MGGGGGGSTPSQPNGILYITLEIYLTPYVLVYFAVSYVIYSVFYINFLIAILDLPYTLKPNHQHRLRKSFQTDCIS